MPRRIRRIDVFLPLLYNDGSAVDEDEFVKLQEEWLARFGGMTFTPRQFPVQGLWEAEGVVYKDRITVFTLLDFSTRSELETLRYLKNLKTRLKKQFDQLDILITMHEITVI